MIKVKRVYDLPSRSDGMRILVDRLWPRGLSKAVAKIDLWMKDIAPSNELRKWFSHEAAKWKEFQRRYYRELDANTSAVEKLRQHSQGRTVTLVYSASDSEHNNAVAIKEYLESRFALAQAR
jgi:uncharacterized protein YeaO (DUF488 family)